MIWPILRIRMLLMRLKVWAVISYLPVMWQPKQEYPSPPPKNPSAPSHPSPGETSPSPALVTYSTPSPQRPSKQPSPPTASATAFNRLGIVPYGPIYSGVFGLGLE